MAAITSATLCSAPAGVALPRRFSAQSLGSQTAIANAPHLVPVTRSNVSRRKVTTCIKAVKNDDGKDGTTRLAGLLLPSVAAMLIGGTPFIPDARAEISSADYYRSLMESVKRTHTEAPAPILTQAPAVAAAPVASATPVSQQASAADDDFVSLFQSALESPSKKAEASSFAQPEQPKAPTAAEIRAKRVEEVARKEREEAERKAAEQKAQAEAAAKEVAAKAEKEAQEKAKQAQETAAKAAAEAAKKKSHGYLPLFLTQFLVLALYAGVITLAFFLPESQSKQLKAKIDELSERVGPLVEKVRPFADKAVSAGFKFTKKAQPIVGKAAQQAVPLARKAVDASKPIVEEVTAKVGTTIQKFTQKSQES